MKLTKGQLDALRWARRTYSDGRVPPFMFRDYRTSHKLLEHGLIQYEPGYGAPMYKFTEAGIAALEAADAASVKRAQAAAERSKV